MIRCPHLVPSSSIKSQTFPLGAPDLSINYFKLSFGRHPMTFFVPRWMILGRLWDFLGYKSILITTPSDHLTDNSWRWFSLRWSLVLTLSDLLYYREGSVDHPVVVKGPVQASSRLICMSCGHLIGRQQSACRAV